MISHSGLILLFFDYFQLLRWKHKMCWWQISFSEGEFMCLISPKRSIIFEDWTDIWKLGSPEEKENINLISVFEQIKKKASNHCNLNPFLSMVQVSNERLFLILFREYKDTQIHSHPHMYVCREREIQTSKHREPNPSIWITQIDFSTF